MRNQEHLVHVTYLELILFIDNCFLDHVIYRAESELCMSIFRDESKDARGQSKIKSSSNDGFLTEE